MTDTVPIPKPRPPAAAVPPIPKPKPKLEFVFNGRFAKARFRTEFEAAFSKDPKYDATALSDAETLLGLIEEDARVTDIRWMAYMLATAYHETAVLKEQRLPVVRKGKPVVDKKGEPITLTQRRWAITMAPVNEVGRGKDRKYFLPVKVRALPEGGAIVTEQDGDQFKVKANGKFVTVTAGAEQGVAANTKAAAAYTAEVGTAQHYFGRGYVQLTWWSNYARTGAVIGKGLGLLLDPDLVLEPKTAYQIMAEGMLNGSGFANGRRFSNYFHGAHTDYLGARAMVNGVDQRERIAKLAKQFETVLMTCKDVQAGTAK
jgi:hypothetical protein